MCITGFVPAESLTPHSSAGRSFGAAQLLIQPTMIQPTRLGVSGVSRLDVSKVLSLGDARDRGDGAFECAMLEQHVGA